MSWEDVKLSDVTPEVFEQLPIGTYTFKIINATTRTNNFGNEELVIQAAITDGEYAGRRVFMAYTKPGTVNSKTGKPVKTGQQLKKLEIALGVDQKDDENIVDYFNRVALNYPFTMELGPAYKIRQGETEPRIVPQLWKVGPAT